MIWWSRVLRWPQYSFPPFRITICECLQRIRIGEQISLVRFVLHKLHQLFELKVTCLIPFAWTLQHKILIFPQILEERMKVTWPLTARETVVHYVLFEYLQDGLVVVVASTVVTWSGWIHHFIKCSFLFTFVFGYVILN